MKTLLIFSGIQHFQRVEQQSREAADESERLSLFEDALNGDVVDESYLQSGSWFTRFLHKLSFIPLPLVKALEVYRRRHHYDVIVSWDDPFALIYALLLMLTRSRSRHVAVLSWMAPPKKAFALKFVQKHIDRIIVWSQNHKELLVEFFGISPSRIVVIPYFVDQKFWRPIGVATEGICSVGDSRRDYATLIEAMRGLEIRCRIVSQVRPSQKSNRDFDATNSSLAKISNLPDNVVLGPASPVELRAIYARSRFVVVPLFPGFRDSGITTVTEAMAMGKAIICSRIYGQIDLLEDGINGIFVRPGDPQALREAIQYLYEHPDVAARMGAEGRRRAEEVFALDHFVANVRQIVDDVITGNRTPAMFY
jgi:glycosyltransferase involved in cell wall biosynthesis